ncbi:D-alanyl-D-alanine carboxypeptidase [Streptomyces sp. NPDC005438]|uniref:D-alanyl-D-alanine carboxypeptidase n=1 Tax=Streptomyces sp. NPDC005438 TaxID=3156880 RepID=UPI0033B07C7B
MAGKSPDKQQRETSSDKTTDLGRVVPPSNSASGGQADKSSETAEKSSMDPRLAVVADSGEESDVTKAVDGDGTREDGANSPEGEGGSTSAQVGEAAGKSDEGAKPAPEAKSPKAARGTKGTKRSGGGPKGPKTGKASKAAGGTRTGKTAQGAKTGRKTKNPQATEPPAPSGTDETASPSAPSVDDGEGDQRLKAAVAAWVAGGKQGEEPSLKEGDSPSSDAAPESSEPASEEKPEAGAEEPTPSSEEGGDGADSADSADSDLPVRPKPAGGEAKGDQPTAVFGVPRSGGSRDDSAEGKGGLADEDDEDVEAEATRRADQLTAAFFGPGRRSARKAEEASRAEEAEGRDQDDLRPSEDAKSPEAAGSSPSPSKPEDSGETTAGEDPAKASGTPAGDPGDKGQNKPARGKTEKPRQDRERKGSGDDTTAVFGTRLTEEERRRTREGSDVDQATAVFRSPSVEPEEKAAGKPEEEAREKPEDTGAPAPDADRSLTDEGAKDTEEAKDAGSAEAAPSGGDGKAGETDQDAKEPKAAPGAKPREDKGGPATTPAEGERDKADGDTGAAGDTKDAEPEKAGKPGKPGKDAGESPAADAAKAPAPTDGDARGKGGAVVPPMPPTAPGSTGKTPDSGKGEAGSSTYVPLRSDAAPPMPQGLPPKPASAPGALPEEGAEAPASLSEPERTRQQPVPDPPPLDLLAQLTNRPPPPETPVRMVLRRVKIWSPLVLLVVVLFVVAQLVRPLPEPELNLTASETYTFEGGKPSMPWPSEGQAVVDVDGLGSLGSYGKQKPVPIASVAKVMTAYVILRDHPVKPGKEGDKIKVDRKAEKDAGLSAQNESTVDVKEGDVITQREAIEAVMIASANNIARLLARWDSKGSEKRFVQKMNDAAKELGMTNTTYTDPSGLRAQTVSTAADQVKLGKEAMRDPLFREVVRMPSYKDSKGDQHRNWNNLVPFDGVVGIKTGTTTKAGGNLLFAAEREVNGTRQLIVGAMLGQHVPPIIDTVLNNSKKLMDAAQAALIARTVIKKGQVVGDVDDGVGGTTPVVATRDVKAVGWPGLRVRLEMDGAKDGVPGEAEAGERVGHVTVGKGAGQVRVPVALQKKLEKPGFGAKLTRVL